MEDKLKKAIEALAEKAAKTSGSIEAMQYTQAALNLANTLLSLSAKV